MKPKIMPPVYFLSLLILSIILHLLIPVRYIIPRPYHYVGVLIIIFGLIIFFWAFRLIRKNNTALKPYKKPSFFILTGPFRISRNPIYLGMFSVLIGTAILLKSLISFVSPVLFIIVISLKIIPVEEKNLLSVFGKEYVRYKRKVRRWI